MITRLYRITRALTVADKDQAHLRNHIQRCFAQSATIAYDNDREDDTSAHLWKIKLRSAINNRTKDPPM